MWNPKARGHLGKMFQAGSRTWDFLIAGSMPERDATGRIYNTSYVF